MYSQYMYNLTNINPAFTGDRNSSSVTLIWKQQWAGLEGAPSSKTVTLDLPSKEKRYGIGIQLFDDKYASIIQRTGANIYYNLKFRVSNNGSLSLGIKGGFYNDKKMLTNVNLGLVSAFDPAFASNYNKIIPLAGAGIYYSDDHFFIGLSSPDVITFSNLQTYKSDSSMYQVNELHYFLTSGYSFDVSENVMIKPSILLKMSSGSLIQADFNLNVWLQNMIGLGASYRKESILGMAEVQVSPRFRIGYAYDLPFKTPNTSELILRYNLGRSKDDSYNDPD